MELLTINEIAGLFKVSNSTVHRWQAAGILPKPVKIGSTVRWRKKDIEKMISDHQNDSEK